MKKIRFLVAKGLTIFKQRGLVGFSTRLLKYGYKVFRVFFLGKQPEITLTPEALFEKRFFHLQHLKSMGVTRETERINIVTDSIGRESLLGGVATALILGTIYANENGVSLRIITREKKVNPEDYEYFICMQGLKMPAKVEFYSDFDRHKKGNNQRLETTDNDIYLTTSWWSTSVVRDIETRGNIFYLLQEVEAFFYPYGDEQYLCGEIMKDSSINFIINSSYLWDYYKKNGPQNIINNGIFFEPAFSDRLYSARESSFKSKDRYSLFFYARPKNPRNMFFYGLKLLNQAITVGLIDPDKWDIYFAGSELPKIKLARGMEAKILGQLKWEEYSELIKKIDLGFSLMYTPHPSYPPLDIASSGGVVLTNKFMNKQSLSYSENIICSELDEKSMMDGFKKAIDLVTNPSLRQKNFKQNHIERSWENTLSGVLSFIQKRK